MWIMYIILYYIINMSQYMEANERSQFIFCYNKTALQSFVMLQNHKSILNTLLKDYKQIVYLWMYTKDSNISEVIEKISQQIQKNSFVFQNTSDIVDFLRQKQKSMYYILICSTFCLDVVQDVLTNGWEFLGVVLFQPRQVMDFQYNSMERGQNKFVWKQDTKQNFKKKMKCSKWTDLNKALSPENWHQSDEKTFPNFISLRRQMATSNQLMKGMCAMIKQQMDMETKSQILDNLEMVTEKFKELHPRLKFKDFKLFQSYFQELKKGQLSIKRIIQIYTSEKYGIYILLNSFLRSMILPTEIYYVQPLFKDIFSAVKRLNQEMTEDQFVCFRGGFITPEEADKLSASTGQIIQNLGFLSTSLSKDTALTFSNNAIYEIKVPKLFSRNNKQNMGFANISSFSWFCGEQQVLFNPLNYFKILQFSYARIQKPPSTPGTPRIIAFYVVLSLGEVAKIREKPKHLITQDQEIIETLVSLQDDNEKYNYNQGCTLLLQNKKRLSVGLLYWQKYRNVLEQFYKIQTDENVEEITYQSMLKLQEEQLCKYLTVLNNISSMLRLMYRFEQAYERLCIPLKIIKSQLLTSSSPNYLMLLQNLISVLTEMGRFDEALEICLINVELSKVNCDKKHLSALIIMGNLFNDKGQYKQSLAISQQCEKISFQIFSPFHPLQVSILRMRAIAVKYLGQTQQAIKLLFRCQYLSKKIQGINNTNYLNILNDLSACFIEMSRYEQARQIIMSIQYCVRQLVGKQHLLYMKVLINKARLLFFNNQFQQALNLFIQLQSIYKKLFGEKSLHYLEILNKLATSYLWVGNYQKAQELNQKCLSMSKEGQPNYLVMMDTKATILSNCHKYRQSIEIRKMLLKQYKQMNGQKHKIYLRDLYNLALILKQSGRHKQSYEYFELCQAKWRLIFGVGSQEHTQILNLFILLQFQMGYYDMALSNVRLLMRSKKCKLGSTFNFMTQISQRIGDIKPALKYFKKSAQWIELKNVQQLLISHIERVENKQILVAQQKQKYYHHARIQLQQRLCQKLQKQNKRVKFSRSFLSFY